MHMHQAPPFWWLMPGRAVGPWPHLLGGRYGDKGFQEEMAFGLGQCCPLDRGPRITGSLVGAAVGRFSEQSWL